MQTEHTIISSGNRRKAHVTAGGGGEQCGSNLRGGLLTHTQNLY